MDIPYIKCHGSDNDFIMIDERKLEESLTDEDRKEVALLLSDRLEGIGSDGILYVLSSSKAEACMRMFNSDGSEAEMCGNGLRCVARYITEETGKEKVHIETAKAVLPVERVSDIYEGIATFSVAIEPVSFSASSLPMETESEQVVDTVLRDLTEDQTFTALSVPNPHIVSVVTELDEEVLENIGKKANNSPHLFPNGVNVSFVRKIDDNKIFVQTYERGVGLTNACGTAMSASSIVSVIVAGNNPDLPVTVMNKGGMVQCIVHDNEEYKVELQGNATYVYEAEVRVDISTQSFEESPHHVHTEENERYSELREFAKTEGGL
ncbi:diaminopimelate epimerase [Salimicrobium jeotgali]|uniref:Diaminopimelate epimerase n=1 Tax=Salimicrobium jeotgali TaxID=1230341 RepID=K2G9L2_9BACI|nr:diaminopimelate epimerase [Salimicrobium jeotgali]EKE31753.1 diaminopimelate epimerase [Salimicrobium jeotgali]MBM7696287.1 diaminopimelate epimerase [Salimicrobium jeotgali]